MDASFASTLSKVFVGFGWEGGELDSNGVMILKDIVYRIPELTNEEWAEIEEYMSPPVELEDSKSLVEQLKGMISSEAEKSFLVDAVRAIISADGSITRAETFIFKAVTNALDGETEEFEKKMVQLFNSARIKRTQTLEKLAGQNIEEIEFVEKPVTYEMLHKIVKRGMPGNITEDEVERICSAGAMMASIAHADGEVHPDETSKICDIVNKSWDIGDLGAHIISEVAVNHVVYDVDTLRLCRMFFKGTNTEERLQFVQALSAVAKADMDVHVNEIECVKTIGTHLKIPNAELIPLIPKIGPVDA